MKNVLPNDIIQLSPEPGVCGNPMLAGCLMTVDAVKFWGVQCFLQCPGENGNMGGQAYYRAKWTEFELTGGKAAWILPE